MVWEEMRGGRGEGGRGGEGGREREGEERVVVIVYTFYQKSRVAISE